VLVPCTSDEKSGEIEGGTAHMATLDGVRYQSYEVRNYHAYVCEREYHDRSKRAKPLIAVGGTVTVVALATRRRPRNDSGDTTYQLYAL
jgi:hypothetical protein